MRLKRKRTRRNKGRRSHRRTRRNSFKAASGMTRSGDNIIITLHGTDVVRVTPNKVTLNTGGWSTPTTVKWMNKASTEYGLGYKVHKKGGKLYATIRGQVAPFIGNTLHIDR